ncbi:hypothetical protein [Hyphobacterium marinum]|uniref:Uncharacterized protein n=1 Tax=Hyphobacterium marinum TaxID=3116574 RepID=A0ABU7LUG4_9PROT|nr:hypothetical protein [Hyphobacterium sp. Y6023]MEE2565197.1 hypothetical protein [Hyphobacterium sp. Y6023]
MSSLPSAHASQRFGRRQIEFFAVSGQVSGTENRMRGNERRIQDLDGANHSVRLADRDGALDEGDSVALLRLQAGPERGSRPVSAINYTQNTWVEIGRGASASLARTGVSRGGVWWFAMFAFMLTALAIVWSDLRTFLVEVNAEIFSVLPDFHLFAWLESTLPSLRGYDLAAQIPGLTDLIASSGVVAADQANWVVAGTLLVVLGLVAYGARTWRVVWVPVFIAAALAAGLMLGGEAVAGTALAILGIAALVFVLAGFVNRIRDAARLRGRIARLSEHLLRHPPVESVTTPPPPRTEPVMASPAAASVPDAATAAGMAAVAAAVADTENPVDPADATETAEPADADDADAAPAPRADADADTDDDLPSDAELEAARASLTEDDQPDTAPLSNRSAPEATSLDVEETRDRDMIMPPPPPMAGPSATAQSGQSDDDVTAEAGDADPVVAEDAPAATTLRASDANSENAAESIALPDSTEPEADEPEAVPAAETSQTPAPLADAAEAEDAGDAPDLPDLDGDDPMMAQTEASPDEGDEAGDDPERR